MQCRETEMERGGEAGVGGKETKLNEKVVGL